MRVAKATSTNTEEIYNLLMEIFGGLGSYYHKRWQTEAEKCATKYLTFIVTHQGKIVGFLACQQLKTKPAATIEWLGVAEQYRNKGAGTKMMNKLIKGLRTLGFKHILVRASNWDEHKDGAWRRINRGDAKVVNYYRKFGFRYRRGWMRLTL